MIKFTKSLMDIMATDGAHRPSLGYTDLESIYKFSDNFNPLTDGSWKKEHL